MTVGTRVKELRYGLGLSQQALAAQLSVRQATVSDWENGKAEPGRGTLRLLADLAESSEDVFGWLVSGSGKPALLRSRRADQIPSTATELKTEASLADIHADFVRRIANRGAGQIPGYYLMEVSSMLLRTHEQYQAVTAALRAVLSTLPLMVLQLNTFGRVMALYAGDVEVDGAKFIGEPLTAVLPQISEAELDGALSRLQQGASEAQIPFVDRERQYELKLSCMADGLCLAMVRRMNEQRSNELGLLLKTG